MTRKEVLKYAKKHYPIGTLIKDVDEKKEVIVDDNLMNLDANLWLSETYLISYCKDPKTNERISGRGYYIFKEGKWAEIISQPVNNNLILAL